MTWAFCRHYSGRILDLNIVFHYQTLKLQNFKSNLDIKCENYTKLYFDAKRFHRKGIKEGVCVREFWCPFSKKKVLFFHEKLPLLANIEPCPKFLEYGQ